MPNSPTNSPKRATPMSDSEDQPASKRAKATRVYADVCNPYALNNLYAQWEIHTDISGTKSNDAKHMLRKFKHAMTIDSGTGLGIVKIVCKEKRPGMRRLSRTFKKNEWASLASMHRTARHTICQLPGGEQIYQDIDMVNALPNVVAQWAVKHDIEVPTLARYNAERDSMLTQVMDECKINRDAAKKIISAAMHQGKQWRRTRNLPEWVKDLGDDAAAILKLAKEDADLLAIAKESAAKKEYPNLEGSLMNALYESLERPCADAMEDKLRELGFIDDRNICSIAADGIQVLLHGSRPVTDDDLRAVQYHVFEQTGYIIQLAVKPMNQVFPDVKLVFDKSITAASTIAAEVLQCPDGNALVAKWIYQDVLGGNYVYCSTSKQWFQCVNGVWTANAGLDIRNVTMEAADELVGGDSTHDLLINCRKTGFLNGVVDMCRSFAETRDFEEKLDCNPKLLPFSDQVLHLDTGEWEPLRPDHFISKTTGYPRPEPDPEMQEYFYERLREMMPERVGGIEYLLAFLALCLGGSNRFQDFVIMWGPLGSNGKTTLIIILLTCMGELARKMGSQALLIPKKGQNEHDDWMSAKGVRFLFFEEPSASCRIQSDNIKDMSGGGKMVSRSPYGRKSVAFRPLFTPWVALNNLCRPTTLDDAVKRRIKIIKFDQHFRNPDDPEWREESIPLDPYLASRAEDVEWACQFLLILIEYWFKYKHLHSLEELRHSAHKAATQDYFDESDPLAKFMRDTYEYTGNRMDRIVFSEVVSDVRENVAENISMRTISILAHKRGAETIKVRGQPGRVLTGIKRKELEAADDEEPDAIREEEAPILGALDAYVSRS